MQIGDTILKVDHQEVTMENYEMALIGCDVPGSKVVLTVKKPEVCHFKFATLRNTQRFQKIHH